MILMIVSAYWLLSIAVCYLVRFINGRRPKNKAMRLFEDKKSMKKKLLEHASIWLLIPLCAPILPFIFFPYGKVFGRGRKKGPRPVPRKFRSSLKKDRVFDTDGKCMSIFEYNKKHNTEFTLDDVYGKGYTKSLSEEDRASIEEQRNVCRLEIEEGLPESLHSQACALLGQGLLKGDLSDFSEILADDIELLFYEKDPVYGKEAVLEYWSSYSERYITNDVIKQLEVIQCNYYVKPCLKMETMYVLFRFDSNGKVAMMFLTPRDTDRYNIGVERQLDVLPYSLDFLRSSGFRDLPDPEADFHNRIPCMRCGMHSENLEWQGLEVGYIIGEQSVCPHCGKTVEFHPVIWLREKNIFDIDNFGNCDIPF